jgi:hypothetical protein
MITKTKEDIIVEMCYTMRHDFGLVKTDSTDFGAGMTPADQAFLYKQMEQLFDNCIAPNMKFKVLS